MIRYVFGGKGHVLPFINVGMGNAYLFKIKKNSVHEEYTNGNKDDIAIDPPIGMNGLLWLVQVPASVN